MDDVKIIDDFPDYVISKEGAIYTARNGMRRLPSRTRDGNTKITLYRHGIPHTRSVALLVAKTYLWNDHDPAIFDTPIHLDNDQTNNHVDNLAWRPRWFAIKYQRQYWRTEYRYATTKVQDEQTGEIYDSLIEPCQRFGLLYMDLLESCTRGDYVFPTWKKFSFV